MYLKELYQGVFTPERPGDFTIRTIGKNNRELNEKEGDRYTKSLQYEAYHLLILL